ncbi:MAG: methyltransferase domain-containing protein [Cyanobacteria bacterium P01_D01_bin.71]
MLSVSPRQITRDLVASYGQAHTSRQFATYIGAYQYLKLYRLVANYAPPNAKVLDWGTGSGHFSAFLVRTGYQASGFGFSEWPEFCQGFSDRDYRYRQGSPDSPVAIPFSDGQFDAVVSVGVLEHVRETGGDEVASLKEIYRLLKPGGHFICYHFPNRYSWIEFLARRTQRFSHPYLFTTRDIHEIVAATPFQLLDFGRYALLPRNIWQSEIGRHARWGPLAGTIYNQVDRLLGRLLPRLCQNYYFVLRKP